MSRRRLVGGFLDQGIVSFTSIVLLMAASHLLDPVEFGRYAVGVGTVQPFLAIARTLAGETLLFRVASRSGAERERWQGDVDSVSGLSVVLGLLSAVVMAIIALVWTDMRWTLLAATMVVVLLVMQDAARHILMVERRINDLVLADAALVVVALLGTVGAALVKADAPILIAIWGAGGAASLLLTRTVHRIPRSGDLGIAWLRRNVGSSSAFLVDALSGALFGYLLLLMVTMFAGVAQAGVFKATMSVFGLTSVAVNYLRTFFVREVRPETVASAKGVWAICLWAGLLTTSVSLAAALVVFLLPVPAGEALFGHVWVSIVSLAGLAAVNRVAAGLCIAPLIVLRVQRISWRATRVRLVTAVGVVPLSFWLVSAFGASGAVIADLSFYVTVAIGWFWLAHQRASRTAVAARPRHAAD